MTKKNASDFAAFMKKVDAAIAAKCDGLTSADLPDFLYDDAFKDGASASATAKAAIAYANGEDSVRF